MLKRINNWFQHAKKYFFAYKNGFYEVSYMGNSPAYMVASIKKMPFVKHDAAAQKLTTNNPFAKGIMHYQEIEEGLWVIYAEMEYKQNFSYKVIYDAYIPCDYYHLSYNINTDDAGGKAAQINHIAYDNRNWTLFKPESDLLDCHFKNSKGNHFSIFFSKDWLQQNLLNGQIQSNKINDFFNSHKTHYIIWPDLSNTTFQEVLNIKNRISKKTELVSTNLLQFKIDVLAFFLCFINVCDRENIDEKHYEIPNSDRLRIMKVEKYLSDNLNNKFEGIETLAKKYNISPTKLKSDFKLMYGKTIFQYFQKLQMQLANNLLKNEDVRIKELAARFGYENPGKFSTAFQKYFNILPSQFLKVKKD